VLAAFEENGGLGDDLSGFDLDRSVVACQPSGQCGWRIDPLSHYWKVEYMANQKDRLGLGEGREAKLQAYRQARIRSWAMDARFGHAQIT